MTNETPVPYKMQVNHDLSLEIEYDQYDIPIYIRTISLSLFPQKQTVQHWHDELEFILITSGTMNYTVGEQEIYLQENEGLIVNARQIHFCKSASDADCSFICILLHPSMLHTNEIVFSSLIEPIINQESLSYIKLDKDSIWQREILGMLKIIYHGRNNITSPLRTISYFSQIMALIYENIFSHSQAENVSQNFIITQNMVGYIQHHFNEHITLADIAKAGAIGQSKCCQLFSNYLHMSPISYLNHYRMDRSAKMLRETSIPITEVALSAGFSDSSYFAKQFKDWSGTSPTKYRKEHFGAEHTH